MDQTELNISIVFRALTKPATFLGVDYDYFLISGLLVALIFIYVDNFFVLLLFFPLHLVGLILCRMDPHIFRLISTRASIGAVKNKSLWQCQSYEVF